MMKILTETPKKILDSLSKIGLQARMTSTEVNIAHANLRSVIGSEIFDEVENEVLFNLKKLEPGQSLNYIEFFTGDRAKIFLVVTFKFILQNWDYEFNITYQVIKRT